MFLAFALGEPETVLAELHEALAPLATLLLPLDVARVDRGARGDSLQAKSAIEGRIKVVRLTLRLRGTAKGVSLSTNKLTILSLFHEA